MFPTVFNSNIVAYNFSQMFIDTEAYKLLMEQ